MTFTLPLPSILDYFGRHFESGSARLPRGHSRPQSPSFLGHVVGYKLSRVALGTRMPRGMK